MKVAETRETPEVFFEAILFVELRQDEAFAGEGHGGDFAVGEAVTIRDGEQPPLTMHDQHVEALGITRPRTEEAEVQTAVGQGRKLAGGIEG